MDVALTEVKGALSNAYAPAEIPLRAVANVGTTAHECKCSRRFAEPA